MYIAAVASLAVIGAAAKVVGVAAQGGRAEANQPDLADRARLTILTQPPPKPQPPADGSKLATLDPAQLVAQQPEPVDPSLQAMLADERRSDLQAAAEQRAFDARIQAELSSAGADTATTPDAGPPLAHDPPASSSGWTSNAEDTPDPVPQQG